MSKSKVTGSEEAPVAEEQKEVKKTSRSRKKAVAPAAPAEPQEVAAAPSAEDSQTNEAVATPAEPVKKPIPPLPRNLVVRDILDLLQTRIPTLSDQQVQQLTLEEAHERHLFFEALLAQALDYDIVLSDTNIWLELLVGHTSSHSDPKVNARLMFERQLEFISKLMKKKGSRFMIMSETYEEIDRFATIQDPTDYNKADWTDELLCRNVAARLAKRLILSQQRENRLRIEGICSESHHGAFADPAIIRRVVDLFASGKKILLLTNDASVAIRSLGMCDDLQRINRIDDATWDQVYAPLRPMACTMDDLKQLDTYTRQYHFLQQAAGASWMQDLAPQQSRAEVQPLRIDENLFRPGDKHRERVDRVTQVQREQDRKEQQKLEEQRKQAQAEIKQAKEEMQRLKAEQQKMENQRKAEEQRRAAEERRQENIRKAEEQRRVAEERRRAKEQRRLEEQQAAAAAAAEPVADVESQPAEAQPVVEAPQPVAEVQPVAAEAQPVAVADAETAAEAPQPAEVMTEAVAAEAEVPAATAAVELPGFSAEDMALISTPKKRTHRGGRRRGGNKPAPQA